MIPLLGMNDMEAEHPAQHLLFHLAGCVSLWALQLYIRQTIRSAQRGLWQWLMADTADKSIRFDQHRPQNVKTWHVWPRSLGIRSRFQADFDILCGQDHKGRFLPQRRPLPLFQDKMSDNLAGCSIDWSTSAGILYAYTNNLSICQLSSHTIYVSVWPI